MRRQHTELACLRRDEGVGQFVGASGQVIGCPGDALIADLRLVEVPPAPTAREGIVRIVDDLHVGSIFALLAGLERLVQDLRPGWDVVFEHDVVGVIGQSQRQAGGEFGVGSKSKRGKRRTFVFARFHQSKRG